MTDPTVRTRARNAAVGLAAWLAPAVISAGGLAQEAGREGGAPKPGFALTIYSSADPASFDPRGARQGHGVLVWQPNQVPGYGVVREAREIALDKGDNTVRFTDVASGIDPTTVAFRSLTAPGSTAVIEQDYEYDLVGADKLLQKYLGESISLRVKDQPPLEGLTLLAADPGTLVLKDGGGSVRLVPRGPDLAEISLPKLPKGLITKPTLVWRVAAGQGGKHVVEVSYQTDGLTWRADYNLVVNKANTKADLSAWVSVLNESGASYPDARLKLVAGDVQRVQPPQPLYRSMMGAAAPMAAAAAPGFQEKAFFEYHLYTLGRPTSLADRSTKQIELFPARPGVSVKKTFVYYGQPTHLRGYTAFSPDSNPNPGGDSNKKVDIYVRFKNDEAHGLGLPLPAGRVRVYQRDEADAALEFVGEDTLTHTPKGEDVLVKLGSAFDVVGERRQTRFEPNVAGHVVTESFEIRVRNHKPEPVDVIIKETLYRWSGWSILQASDRYEKQDSRTVHFPVTVPADGEKTVTYTVRYTW